MRHVIIGNGIAGINAAETIRELDPDATVTMIARESFPPYSRPMISMVLEGGVDSDKLPIRSESFYDDLRIEPIVGEEVLDIDLDRSRVITDKGSKIPFDKLLIASGADPRPIDAEGLDLGNIFFMRTERHVLGILEALSGVRRALVLGGGLVGFKAAYGLMRRGVKVTMLIGSGYPLSMQLDETAGRMVMDELVANGLDVRVGTEAVSFEGNGAVRQARLSDRGRIDCELVVVGKGVLPAFGFVPRDRIDTDQGILVDEHMRTRVPSVYAAGDVAEAFDVVRGTRRVNAIWPVAAEQGRIAGMNMAGRPVSYPGSMGRNVIRVFGLDVLTGGIVNPPDEEGYTVLEGGSSVEGTYRRLVLRDRTPVGTAMVGRIDQGGVLLSLIRRGQPLRVDPEVLLDRSFNFGRLLS
jgi:NAD(P)H-nitrite reductase large subunit